jgi:transcriptional regulator with XRE-family HTH domain
MPATLSTIAPEAQRQLQALGTRIRARRKSLRVSATTAAEAAGMSRVTLHRIESGEGSVTMGAYANAMAALGLALDVGVPLETTRTAAPATLGKIRLADHPQLRRLGWQLPDDAELTPQEALNLYERNWRHVDRAAMDARESALLEALIRGPGKGHLLV